jgi:hypothetical protein
VVSIQITKAQRRALLHSQLISNWYRVSQAAPEIPRDSRAYEAAYEKFSPLFLPFE